MNDLINEIKFDNLVEQIGAHVPIRKGSLPSAYEKQKQFAFITLVDNTPLSIIIKMEEIKTLFISHIWTKNLSRYSPWALKAVSYSPMDDKTFALVELYRNNFKNWNLAASVSH